MSLPALRQLDGATVRNRLAALSSLFEYLCEKNAVSHNLVKGVKRPRAETGEGKTQALGGHQAHELLAAANEETLKSKRIAPFCRRCYSTRLRREELCRSSILATCGAGCRI